MPSTPKKLSELQIDLLRSALASQKGTIWLPKAASESLPTTYSALVSLGRRKLMEPEAGKDPAIVTWKITKAGREAVGPAKAGRSEIAPAPTASPKNPVRKAAPAPAASQGSRTAAPLASPSSRSAPVVAGTASRERGGKGKEAVPAAKPSRTSAKKPLASPKLSGGRGRT